MKLTFLGTGGGRFSLVTQLRSTAGIFIETEAGLRLVLDPGSGTMLRARQERVNLQRTNALLITHAHPDDSIDADAVIEAMTEGALKKKGMLICSKSVLEGEKKSKIDPRVSTYHRDALDSYRVLKPGEKITLGGKNGDLTIRATKTKHSDTTTIGFLLIDADGIRVGITADSGYFKGMEDPYKNADALVVNCMFPRTPESLHLREEEKTHMNVYDAAKLIKAAQPKQAILWKFGMKMLRANPFGEAAWIEKQTKTRCSAAKDGESFHIIRTKKDEEQKRLA